MLASAGPAVAANTITVSMKWSDVLGAGSAVYMSSPNVATLDGSGPSVVVGSRNNGCLYAVDIGTGNTTPGWPRCTGYGLDATPSVLPAGGGTDDIIESEGTPNSGISGTRSSGGIVAYGSNGSTLWSRTLPDVFGTFGNSPVVDGSAAIGDPGTGQETVVVGGVSLSMYALNPTTGATDPGWPQETPDSTEATEALANVNGTQYVVAASDATGGSGAHFSGEVNGGSVRLMTGGGQSAWTDWTNEVVSSGAVVGNLTGSGPVAVFGHGDYWINSGGGSSYDTVTAVNAANGGSMWTATLNGPALAAPAIADLLGNGQQDVIEPSWFNGTSGSNGGEVFALNPSNGSSLWTFTPPSATTITGSVATANFGEGYQDVVVATGGGWYLLDGKSGAAQAGGQALGTSGNAALDPCNGSISYIQSQDAPLVVPDPSGTGLDVIVAGTCAGNGSDANDGVIAAYQVTDGSATTNSVGTNAWPEFKGNPQLSGSNIPVAPPPGSCTPDVPPCSTQGYLLAGSDGGVFSYGATNYYGSLPGDHVSVNDVVAIAATGDLGGYYMVATDGGVFAFGDAGFHGSMGGHPLNKPVVGMAVDPGTGGYWEVASDGGIFAFGAPFYGSMGGHPLNQPIVGMAYDPGTGGYWEVASDGGIFAFGAPFYGSMGGHPLNKPIVGMAYDRATGGYWMVASDGGVFAFDAGFHGSMGGRPLNKPVVGLSGTDDGGGYWEVASDGGIFAFGDAYFRGSAGDLVLARPVVGLSSTG
ncbi:MAG: outer membrane protein assembly factor BamB family protein [Acidimicrobiales bacterium]